MGKSSRLVPTIALLLFAIFAGWQIWTTPGLRPVVVSIYEPAMISAEQRVIDIGKVETDSKIAQEFVLFNKGGSHLRISGVDTSCGCTVAALTENVLAPGEFTRLKVELDTSIKLGPVRKKITVKSNDPKRPALDLFLVGEVMTRQMKAHEEPVTVSAKDPLVLFKGECVTCHVARGKGKTGQALFQADCGMCHGMNGQGTKTSGPALLEGNYDDAAYLASMRRVIADGSPRSPEMPPFSEKKGGPLNDAEIDSLVNFLKFQATQNKMGLLDSDTMDEADEAALQEALKNPH